MCVIRINRLTMGEAEGLVVMLWRVLEEYRIPSPRLSVYPAGDAVDLGIEFHSEQEAALVRRVVPRIAADAALASAPGPPPDLARSISPLLSTGNGILSFARGPNKNKVC
jgi:hypothetical protein